MDERPPKTRAAESGYLDGKRYDIAKVYKFAEATPAKNVPLEEFRYVISEDNDTTYEIDGKTIRPCDIVKNWNVMQNDPTWQKHARSVTRVDLDQPILISHSGHVLDGQHRVIKAFIEGKTDIKVKRLPQELPVDLEMGG